MLERQLECCLHHARSNRAHRSDLSEVRIAGRVVGHPEVRMVECIEHFPAELEIIPFLNNMEVLHHADIPRVHARSFEQVSATVAERSGGVGSKSSGVEVMSKPLDRKSTRLNSSHA